MFTPEELLIKMGQSAFEFEHANRQIRELAVQFEERSAKLRIITEARRFDLITNDKLRAHLEECAQNDKFKPTLDFINAVITIECGDLAAQLSAAKMLAKQAADEFGMWSNQLMWYQSQNKFRGIELMTLKD